MEPPAASEVVALAAAQLEKLDQRQRSLLQIMRERNVESERAKTLWKQGVSRWRPLVLRLQPPVTFSSFLPCNISLAVLPHGVPSQTKNAHFATVLRPAVPTALHHRTPERFERLEPQPPPSPRPAASSELRQRHPPRPSASVCVLFLLPLTPFLTPRRYLRQRARSSPS